MTATSDDKRKALAEILAAHPGNSCSVQCARIWAALSRFNLTTFKAMRHLDVCDPRARVLRLRHAASESGHLHRVGGYVLEIGAPR